MFRTAGEWGDLPFWHVNRQHPFHRLSEGATGNSDVSAYPGRFAAGHKTYSHVLLSFQWTRGILSLPASGLPLSSVLKRPTDPGEGERGRRT